MPLQMRGSPTKESSAHLDLPDLFNPSSTRIERDIPAHKHPFKDRILAVCSWYATNRMLNKVVDERSECEVEGGREAEPRARVGGI